MFNDECFNAFKLDQLLSLLLDYNLQTYLGKHFIRITAKVRIEALRTRRVQVLLHEARRINLVIIWLVLNLNGLATVSLARLDLLDKVSTLLFTCLLMAHRLQGMRKNSVN